MAELYVGLMSGTSLDAVDGALVDFSTPQPRTLAFASRDLPGPLRGALMALQHPGDNELDRSARASIALTRLYAAVVEDLLAAAAGHDVAGAAAPGGPAGHTAPVTPATTAGAALASRPADPAACEALRARIGAIGAHGQTVRHRPDVGYTIQLLDGALLAESARLPVVCDLRSADVAAGGQGAPLVPAFHAAVFAHPARRRVVLNVGGIANVSLLAPGEPVSGFDTGPGNMLLDHWCALHVGTPYDRDGAWAAGGTVDATLLETMRSEPYFARTPPKSTGRDLFDAGWLERMLRHQAAPVPPRDVQATLAELTAGTAADACRTFGAHEIFVCGGGASNADLMARLRRCCAPARVESTDALGAAPQSVEAVAFAWLAARRLLGEPGNLPAVTGARGPRVLGALHAPPPRAEPSPRAG